jgi:hypothetical protein
MHAKIATAIALLLAASGCALVPEKYQLAAEPLMDIPLTATFTQASGAPGAPPMAVARSIEGDPMAQANSLVQDSQRKCAAFVNSLFAETAGTSLALDVLSTGTSAVAAIVNPLSTAHALSAASTILGATRTSITANYLNTLSLANISQAILGSYNDSLTDYINHLAVIPNPSQINIYLERSKILNIHKKCALAAAQSTISNTLQGGSTTDPTQGLKRVHTVTDAEADPKNGLAKLTANLAGEINETFGKAGVKATASGNVITLARSASVKLVATASSNSLVVQYTYGPPDILAISGKPKKGDTISIAGPSAVQQSGAGTTPSTFQAPALDQTATPAAPPNDTSQGAAGVTAPVLPAPPAAPRSPAGPAAVTSPATPPGAALNKQ